MKELIIIVAIPFIVATILKIIYIFTIKKEDKQESINLMSENADYDTYIKINENIMKGEVWYYFSKYRLYKYRKSFEKIKEQLLNNKDYFKNILKINSILS